MEKNNNTRWGDVSTCSIVKRASKEESEKIKDKSFKEMIKNINSLNDKEVHKK